MIHIQYPHRRDDGQMIFVELVECDEQEWMTREDRSHPQWSVCWPEPDSSDRLVRATRLLNLQAARGLAGVLRLAVGT